jgi:hypothetical protein
MNCGVDCSGGLQPWITRLLYPSFVWFRGLLDATTDTYITSFRLHHNRRVLFIRSIDCDFCCLKLWTNAPAATKHLHGPYMCEFWSSAGAALLEWLALNFVSSVGSSRRTCALFRFPNLVTKFTMQNFYSPSHQNAGTYRWNKKLIAQFCYTLPDEHFKFN